MMNTATATADGTPANTLKFQDSIHQVDVIVGFKRDRRGQPQFQVQMSCPCCAGRVMWFTKTQFQRNGCAELEEQASQIEEYQN